MTDDHPSEDRSTDEQRSPEEETKARFQEALARKQQRHHASAPGDPSEQGKPHHAAGPAGQKREFRRKSG